MLCLDNSEFMRNSDYAPSRLQAQKDAVNLLCSRHIGADGTGGSNAESTIGLLTMAGACVDVRAAPSRNRNLLYQAVDGIPIKGSSQIVKGVKIAQLALKHGIETKGVKRVVVFVGSPIQDNQRALKKVGKHLRRNNVSVDAVMMGDFPENEAKLRALVDTARTEDGPPCELMTIPPGVRPVDVLRRTHLCGGAATGAAAAAAATATGTATGGATTGTTSGSNFEEYGGFDPSVDPEMAQAMKMSMMEERARMEKAMEESKKDAGVVEADDPGETEEEMLAKALELSMAAAAEAPVSDIAVSDDNTPPAKKSRKEPVSSDASATEATGDESAGAAAAASAAATDVDADGDLDLGDPAALAMLLSGVGVGADDPLIQAALEQINEDADSADGDDQKTE